MVRLVTNASTLGTPVHARARLLVAAVALATVGTGEAAAQTSQPFDAFRLPGSGLECNVRAPSTDDPHPSSFLLEFSEGEELIDERLIDVGYDSTGAPLWLMMLADESLGSGTGDGKEEAGWRVMMHGYFVRFGPGASVAGFHKPGLRTRDPRPAVAGGTALSPEAIARARSLASWLWHNRCGVSYSTR